MNSCLPLVSIIIPTFNSGKTLEKCLQSIINQTYKKCEIIIVDANSKDDTIAIAQKMGVNIHIIPEISMAAATNFGFRRSEGRYIYRVDSDVILDDKLIEEAINKCENEDYDGVCIFWLPDASISMWARIRRFEKECLIEFPSYVGGISYSTNVFGARFLKREVITQIGMIDENIPTAGEDYVLYDKLGKSKYRFATINSRELHQGEPRSIVDIIKKQYHYGTTLLPFFKKNLILGVVQMSPLRNSLIKNWRKFLSHPFLTMGFIIYEFIVYFSTTIGFIVGFFWASKKKWHDVQ